MLEQVEIAGVGVIVPDDEFRESIIVEIGYADVQGMCRITSHIDVPVKFQLPVMVDDVLVEQHLKGTVQVEVGHIGGTRVVLGGKHIIRCTQVLPFDGAVTRVIGDCATAASARRTNSVLRGVERHDDLGLAIGIEVGKKRPN